MYSCNYNYTHIDKLTNCISKLFFYSKASKNGMQFTPARYLLGSIFNLRQMTIVFDSVLLVAMPFSQKKVSAKYLECTLDFGFSSFLVYTKAQVEKIYLQGKNAAY